MVNKDFVKFYETKTMDEIIQLREWSVQRIEAMDFVLGEIADAAKNA
jgi:hypothetical protein